MYSNPPSRPAPTPPSGRVYPHVQDLIARTNCLPPVDSASIKSWLENAQRHWHQAKAHHGFGRLDAAYVDYLTAFTIVVNVIPKCREYPTFRVSGGAPLRAYELLKNTLDGKTKEFAKVKEEIMKDNESSGVLSTQAQLDAQNAQSHTPEALLENGTAAHVTKKPVPNPRPGSLSMPDHRAFGGSETLDTPNDRTGGALPTDSQRAAPETDLEARFKRLSLKGGMNGTQRKPVESNSSSPRIAPQGPRSMPQKLPPLDVTAMPQMPAPTYSPQTSYASPGGGLSPPRRPSFASGRVISAEEEEPGKSTTVLSKELSLTADTLLAYIRDRKISVLLLDVRSREEFDEGHIYAGAIVCIEPLVLRDGMSADDLEETFVLAPQQESDLFSRRDEFDLVVYYDQSTAEATFVANTARDEQDRALRSLYSALYDYAFRKRLRRPPMLLRGGLNAWIDIVGTQSLKVGNSKEQVNTAQNLGSPLHNGVRTTTPANRVSTPRQQLLRRRQDRRANGSSLPPPLNRNKLNGNEPESGTPISGEEERQWMDRLHKESDPLTISVPPSSIEDDDVKKRHRGMSIVSNSSDVAYNRTLEDFFQKYPATPNFPESMTMPSTPQIFETESAPGSRRNIVDHPFHGFTDVRNPEFNPPASPARPPPVVPRKSYSGVSERLMPAATTPPIAPDRPPKVPLSSSSITSSSGIGAVSLASTGLKNLGNTCYMNSILQCMNGTRPLSRFFLDGSYKHQINKDNPLGSRGVLAEAYANIVRHLSSGEYTFISPVTFKDVSGRLNETFRTNHQQDAQEFLEFLLDGLHEDLNAHATRTKLRSLTDEEERRREKMPMQVVSTIEWQRYVHLNLSIIVTYLQGQLSSRLRCLTCNVTSTTYSPFMYLTLPIPDTSKGGRVTLHDCLNEFCREEVLEHDDEWNCPECKRPRKATKKLTITRLPHVLIVHLKRFSSKGRWRNKLDTFINFPVTDLNLTPYVPPPLPHGDGVPKPDPQASPPFLYDLYSCANHYGNLEGGHYTAFVRSVPHRWTVFDDTKATPMEESSVVSAHAYVLFWVRKGVM